MKKALLPLALLIPAAASAITPLWMRDVKISPDGRTIAFCYMGDIYTVPAAGGRATALTSTADVYEASPVWSPDSRSIAYASDRNGNFDVYIIDATGGTPRRLTVNSAAEIPEAFAPDGLSVLYSAAIQAPAASAAFPSARLTQLYSVATDGQSAPVQILGTPARFVSWAPDGRSFLYQDVKGFEDEFRKHHTSSVTRDIWLYDLATGSHTNLTDRPGENTNPVMESDGTFVFLSERDGGSSNVYRASVVHPAQVTALTHFAPHPVRFLSRGADGTLAFGYDGEIYTLAPGATEPVKVTIDITVDDTPRTDKLPVRSGAESPAASPDGKSIAFIYRGNVFVTSTEYSTTKQISDTPAAEADVCWAPSSQTLYYTSERDGIYNIYKATMVHEGETDFPYATLIKEEPLFSADGHERNLPKASPDGSKLAYILDRQTLAVLDLNTGRETRITDGTTYPQRDALFNFTWSPDSKWIALEIIDRKHDPYTDIALLNASTGELLNLTNSGYFDAEPRWVMGGDAIMFASERYGMRNHASWGSQMDAMLVFMNQEALDRWTMDKEDLEVYKASLDDKSDADKDKKDAKDKKDSQKPIDVQLDGITDRIVRVTPQSVAYHDAILTPDGETLYYLADSEDGTRLWKYCPREEEHRVISSVSGHPRFDISSDGKDIFLLGSRMQKLNPKSDKLTSISYSATMPIDYAAERRYMYDNMVREEAARFYVEDMHGVDWPAMTEHYRRFLPHISNNYDFAEMLSELLGELNVSHTGGRYMGPAHQDGDRTASLGLLYDLAYQGDGLRIAEVVYGGPFATARSKARPGVIVETIDGQKLDAGADPATLLTDRGGRRTLVGLYDPADGTRWDEVIKPISAARMTSIMYDRWVKGRAAYVDSISGGRLGYVHVKGMDDASFRRVYSDLLGKYNDREGVVIDVRWNGGGRLHEDIEVLFSGQKYFTQEVRGTETCDMPSRRWNKPSIMVMCEACYSNAHGTPWVYSHQKIGKTVGMPVPGTMTSVNWVGMQDPSMIFGIPVIGYRLPDGSFLENQQLEPDIKIANDPARIVRGEDAQLRTAVETLLHDIDAAKK